MLSNADNDLKQRAANQGTDRAIRREGRRNRCPMFARRTGVGSIFRSRGSKGVVRGPQPDSEQQRDGDNVRQRWVALASVGLAASLAVTACGSSSGGKSSSSGGSGGSA